MTVSFKGGNKDAFDPEDHGHSSALAAGQKLEKFHSIMDAYDIAYRELSRDFPGFFSMTLSPHDQNRLMDSESYQKYQVAFGHTASLMSFYSESSDPAVWERMDGLMQRRYELSKRGRPENRLGLSKEEARAIEKYLERINTSTRNSGPKKATPVIALEKA